MVTCKEQTEKLKAIADEWQKNQMAFIKAKREKQKRKRCHHIVTT